MAEKGRELRLPTYIAFAVYEMAFSNPERNELRQKSLRNERSRNKMHTETETVTEMEGEVMKQHPQITAS
jgi:hypothetical protein